MFLKPVTSSNVLFFLSLKVTGKFESSYLQVKVTISFPVNHTTKNDVLFLSSTTFKAWKFTIPLEKKNYSLLPNQKKQGFFNIFS